MDEFSVETLTSLVGMAFIDLSRASAHSHKQTYFTSTKW